MSNTLKFLDALSVKLSGPFAGLLLVGILAGAQPAAGAEPWPSDLAAAKARAAEEGRLIVVDLFAEWCGWCKVLEKEVFASAEFERFAEGKELVRLDVEDGAEGSRIQSRFEAYNLPTTLILDTDEVMVGRIEGMWAAEVYVERMRQEIEGFRRLEATYERTVSEPEKVTPEQLRALAGTFHQRRDGERAAELYQRLETNGWKESGGQAMLSYRRADALRLARRWDDAEAAVKKARRLAVAAADEEVVEAVDLLGIQIATDLGDCEKRRGAMESFLRQHPESERASQVTKTLSALKSAADGSHCSS